MADDAGGYDPDMEAIQVLSIAVVGVFGVATAFFIGVSLTAYLRVRRHHRALSSVQGVAKSSPSATHPAYQARTYHKAAR